MNIKMIDRITNKHLKGYSIEHIRPYRKDFYQEGYCAYLLAISSYNSAIGTQLNTWIHNCIGFAVKDYYNYLFCGGRARINVNFYPIDELALITSDSVDVEIDSKIIEKGLNEVELAIIKAIKDDKNMTQLARDFCIPYTTFIKIRDKLLIKLKEKYFSNLTHFSET